MTLPLHIGLTAEQLACEYLQEQGLTLITQNYRCKPGEIDLIMLDKGATVFVEVRYREDEDYGSSLESITPSKQAKLKRAATNYLLEQNQYDKVPCRFDVVAMTGHQDSPEIDWIQNAF